MNYQIRFIKVANHILQRILNEKSMTGDGFNQRGHLVWFNGNCVVLPWRKTACTGSMKLQLSEDIVDVKGPLRKVSLPSELSMAI